MWNRVAAEENQGNIDLIDKELRAAVPDAAKTEYAGAKIASLAAARKRTEKHLARQAAIKLGKKAKPRSSAAGVVRSGCGRRGAPFRIGGGAALSAIVYSFAGLRASPTVRWMVGLSTDSAQAVCFQ